MGTELSRDLRSNFIVLEQQANSLLRSGNYELAEKIFRAMLDTVMKRQQTEERRIHKGSYLHNIGFSILLQDRLMEALHSFLLAYVEDTLNVSINHEDDADKAPAGRVLKQGFSVINRNLQSIKNIARSKKKSGAVVYDPNNLFEEFLQQVQVDEQNLFALCDRPPTPSQVRGQLVVNLTPEAKRALDAAVSRTGNMLLQIAVTIARKRGRISEVTEDDIKEAIRQLEEKTSE